MLRYLTGLLLLLLAGCTAGVNPLPDPREMSFAPLDFSFPEVARESLDNGMELYLLPDDELPLIDITVMIGGGSIDVSEEKTGLGGVYAATWRSGGAGERTPDQVDSELDLRAMNLGINTDNYTSSLHLSLRKEDLPFALTLLRDLLLTPGFDADRMEIVRKQAIEAVRRRDDNPGSTAGRVLRAALYPNHPLGRVSSAETLNAIEREDLLAFHRRHVHPDNLLLGISGDFSPVDLGDQLESLFGAWSKGRSERQEIPPLTPSQAPAVHVADRELTQTTIFLGDRGIEKGNPDQYPLRVMNYILGGGSFNSRLMREIRSNRGLAYSVYSQVQIGRRLPGMILLGGETKSGSTLEVVGLMRQEMEKLRADPVPEQELALAKESLINSFVFAFDQRHEVVSRAMRLDFFDYPPNYLEQFRENIASVTAADVQQVAKVYLRPEMQTVVLVGQEQDFDAPPATLGLPVTEVSRE
ncbi:MAG: insulinase family protein [Desulfuromonas sp.]|nr:MAG: insulinase family protein [Desulfuromonas sp.]